jgi:hypothetical protein
LKGRSGLLVVVLATALVMTPLVLGGALLGLYLGGMLGFSGSVLAIGFSTAGFVAGMLVLFRVIRWVVGQVGGSSPRPS